MRISEWSSDVCSSDLFEAPDEDRFPALRLTRQAAEAGGAAPAILNAANEVAVAAFLKGALGFLDIAMIVEDVLNRSEEQTSELQSLMRISYAGFCLKQTNTTQQIHINDKLQLQNHYKRPNSII